ncbi:hypothetical protein [Flavobacterium aestivum]|uniref:hypothetical protein n=1 Tax=Flavobacterium aestivum TaxID=3003257 RepID=UPI002285EED0|nr:hypothetical protein [Flavobacterium aestivum]
MKTKFNPRKYYLTLLILSIIWVTLGPNYYNNYSPFIFFIFGVPIFGYHSFSSVTSFSSQLKVKEPELFRINKIDYGNSKDEMINGMNLFNNPDFEKLTDKELVYSFRNSKSCYNYTILSFFSIIIIAIMSIYIKY